MNLQNDSNNKTKSSQQVINNNQSSIAASTKNQNNESESSSTTRRTSRIRRAEHDGEGKTTSSSSLLVVPSCVISSSSSSVRQSTGGDGEQRRTITSSTTSRGEEEKGGKSGTSSSNTTTGRGRGGRGRGNSSRNNNMNHHHHHHHRQRSVSTGDGNGGEEGSNYGSHYSSSRRDRSNSFNHNSPTTGGRNKNNKKLPPITAMSSSPPPGNNRNANANSLLNFHHSDTRQRELLGANSKHTKMAIPKKQKPLTKHELESQRLERRARFKQASAFFLQTSSHHKFILRRNHSFVLENQLVWSTSRQARTSTTTISQHTTTSTPYTKSKSAEGGDGDSNNVINIVDMTNIPWEAIEFVKVLIELGGGNSAKDELNTSSCCPICLNEFIAPRIIPCGHIFCFSCLLHHWFTSSSSSTSSSKTTASAVEVKCPCCSVYVTDLQQLRPVVLCSVMSPQVSPSTSGKSAEADGSLIFQKLYTMKHHHGTEGGGATSSSRTSPTHRSTAGHVSALMPSNDQHHYHRHHHGHSKQQQQVPPQPPPRRPVTVVHAEGTDAPLPLPILPSYSDKDSMYYRFMIQDNIPIAYSEILEHDLQMLLLDIHELDEQRRLVVVAGNQAAVQACDTQQSFNQMAKDMIQLKLSQIRQTIQQTSVPIRATSDVLFDNDLETPTAEKKATPSCQSSSTTTTPVVVPASVVLLATPPFSTVTEPSTSTLNANANTTSANSSVKDEWEDHLDVVDVTEKEEEEEHHNAEHRSIAAAKTTTSSTATTTTPSLEMTPKSKTRTKKLLRECDDRHSTINKAAFYQTNDGQLCFLSGFNMACVKYEAEILRLKKNEEEDGKNNNDHDRDNEQLLLKYLPTTIHGCTVVDVEKVHVSPHVRQHRLNFLHYHVPLYTDVYLVELNLFDSSYLSKETKEHFREENEQRKKKRKAKKLAEKKLDKQLSRKQSQEEEEQRRLMFATARPDFENDTFFHASPAVSSASSEHHPPLPLEEGFGPALSSTPTRAVATVVPQLQPQPGIPSAASILFGRTQQQQTTAAGQYNRVTASQGYFPDLATSMATLSLPKTKKKQSSPPSSMESSPCLTPTTATAASTGTGAWGTTRSTSSLATTTTTATNAIVSASSSSFPVSRADSSLVASKEPTLTKKKGKGRSKVVLFSTGGGGR